MKVEAVNGRVVVTGDIEPANPSEVFKVQVQTEPTVAEALNAILLANDFHLNRAVIRMAQALDKKAVWYDMRIAITHLSLVIEELEAHAEDDARSRSLSQPVQENK